MTATEELQFLLTKLQETADRKHCEDGDYYSPSDNGSYDDAFDDGADTAVYLFTSAANDTSILAAELTLIGFFQGVAATAAADYVFIA